MPARRGGKKMYIVDGLEDAVRGSCVAAREPRRPRGATRVRVPQADVPRPRITQEQGRSLFWASWSDMAWGAAPSVISAVGNRSKIRRRPPVAPPP